MTGSMVSRRRRFFTLALLFMFPAPAHAGVAAREGTEIVYRGDAGRDAVYAEGTAEAVHVPRRDGHRRARLRRCTRSSARPPASPRSG